MVKAQGRSNFLLICIFFLISSCRQINEDVLNKIEITDTPSPLENESNSEYYSSSSQNLGNTRSFGIEIADIDLDNDNDLFVTNYTGTNKLWINDGTGEFTNSGINFGKSNGQAHDVGIADFNGDSYPDIVVIFHKSFSKVFLNDGKGGFSDSEQNIGEVGDAPQYLSLGDIDADGDIDFFIMYARLPNRLWLNDGQGFFSRSDVEFGGPNSPKMLVMDFNGDQLLDLVFCYLDHPSEVFFNDGSGGFNEPQQTIGASIGCDSLDGGDIDGDGDNDLVLSKIERGVKIWLNDDNSGTFIGAAPDFYPGTIKVKLLDADLDGDLDLIAANINENENRLWLNEGSGIYQSTDQLFGTYWAMSIAADKLDADNGIDIVIGNENDSDGIEIYFSK